MKRGASERKMLFFKNKRQDDKNITQLLEKFEIYNTIYLNSINYESENKFRDLDKHNQINIFYRDKYKVNSEDYGDSMLIEEI